MTTHSPHSGFTPRVIAEQERTGTNRAAAPLVGYKPSLMWRFVHAALRPLLGRARP